MKDCPCNKCIVSPICNEACINETKWGLKVKDQYLNYIQEGKYKYKRTMSRESAEFILQNYGMKCEKE